MQGFKRITDTWYPNINLRVTAPFLVVIVIVAGMGILIVTRLVSGSIQERLNTQLSDSATTAATAVAEIEENYLATLRLMVYTEGVESAIMERDTERIDRLLAGIAANARVSELIVFDATGESFYRLSSEGGADLIDVRGWDAVQRVLAGDSDARGDKFVDIVTLDDTTVFVFAGPVTDAEGTFVGGVVIGLTSTQMIRLLREQALATIVLMDTSGAVIDSSLRPVPDWLYDGPFYTQPDAILTGGERPLQQRMINEVEYEFLYTPFSLRDVDYGVLGVALPVNFVTDRISTSRDTFALMFGVVFVAVAGMGILIAQSIVRPVLRMVDTTRAIRGGDLTRRVELRIPDELGELSSSFDHMTDQLVERNQEISKLYVAQLEETARRDAVLASITDAVIVLDMQGRSILANRAAHDLNAMLKDDAGARRVFQGLLAKAQTLTIPRLVSLMDRHFNVLATPVTLEDGGLLGYVIVFYDISDLIEAQRLKDELILQLSHELRTPLTAVHGYVSMVQVYGGMNGDSADLVDKAMEQVNLLSGMLNHVIEVSAILADQLEIDHERFDVNQIVIDTVEEHRAAIDRAGMRLNLVAFREQICIDGDPIRIGEAVAHILTNAYYYTLPGGSIEVSVEHTGLEVEIAIVDTGVGIAPEEQEKVFERMYRGKSADAGPTDARGLGLGLFLARAIVEAHGGRIDLESQVNAGTVVMMILPVRPHERQS